MRQLAWREATDVGANFDNQRLGHRFADAWNRRAPLDHRRQRAEEALKTTIHRPQPFFDRFNLREVLDGQDLRGLPLLERKRRLPTAMPAVE